MDGASGVADIVEMGIIALGCGRQGRRTIRAYRRWERRYTHKPLLVGADWRYSAMYSRPKQVPEALPLIVTLADAEYLLAKHRRFVARLGEASAESGCGRSPRLAKLAFPRQAPCSRRWASLATPRCIHAPGEQRDVRDGRGHGGAASLRRGF